MNRAEGIRRYIIFFFGLIFVSFGIAFTTKAMLGTSPITSIPYSLSLVLPQLSLGKWTILFNFLLIILQWVLLKKDAKKIELILQVLFTFIFFYHFCKFRSIKGVSRNIVIYIEVRDSPITTSCIFSNNSFLFLNT